MAHGIVGTTAYQGRCPAQLLHAGRRACILRVAPEPNAAADVIAGTTTIIPNCILPSCRCDFALQSTPTPA
jgi:hypothetical protein